MENIFHLQKPLFEVNYTAKISNFFENDSRALRQYDADCFGHAIEVCEMFDK